MRAIHEKGKLVARQGRKITGLTKIADCSCRKQHVSVMESQVMPNRNFSGKTIYLFDINSFYCPVDTSSRQEKNSYIGNRRKSDACSKVDMYSPSLQVFMSSVESIESENGVCYF